MGAQRPQLEVADLVRLYADRLCESQPLSAAQLKVMRHVATCRTAALGGHVDECDQCGHHRISYNSCRDRHCPKCQGKARALWLEQRLTRLLPVPYFHVVFTLPAELGPLVLRNKRLCYDTLFRAATKTLQQIAADPRHLGAQIAITAILHTWGQNLLFHPHLHCVVTGGGLSSDQTRWVAGRENFFLPVRVLARLFRGKFLAALQHAYRQSQLRLYGPLTDIDAPETWAAYRDQLYHKDWIVYAKPPFGGPQQVFRYLGRYTHRVAISNHRLVRLEHDRVTFTVRDSTNHGKTKPLTLDAVEFLRRFLLHVLPKGFVRIRHYGLHAPSNVDTKLALARQLLQSSPTDDASDILTHSPRNHLTNDEPWMRCPQCNGHLVRKRTLPPGRALFSATHAPRPPPTAVTETAT